MLKSRFEVYHFVLRAGSRRATRVKLLLLALVSLLLPVHATVYYVDSGSGSDSNTGTSKTSPWAHIPGSTGVSPGSGWSGLVPFPAGTTIIVKGGSVNNYQLYLHPTNYNGNNVFDSIVIQSGDLTGWGTGKAVIDVQNAKTVGVIFFKVKGVTLDGFEVRNIQAGAFSEIDGSSGSCCVGIDGPTSFTIKRCYLHDAAGNANNMDQGHGIEMSAVDGYPTNFIVAMNVIGPNLHSKGCETYSSSFGVLSNNFITGTGEHCIVIGSHSTNVDICNNLVYNTSCTTQPDSYGIEVVSGQGCDVWNNVVYTQSPLAPASGFGMYEYDYNNRFVFNTVGFLGDPSNDGGATALRLGDGSQANQNTLLMNNIAYKNFNADGKIQYCVRYPSTVSQENVQYNCFWGGGSTSENVMAYRPTGAGNDTVSPLSTYNPPTSGHTYANNVQLDPVLTGGSLPTGLDANYQPNTPYFMLSLSSPASVTSTGNAISGDPVHGWDHSAGKFSKDILGNTRTRWSMGAYEASAASGALLTVSPGSQNFGTMTAGATSNLTFTVKNSGTTTLSGTATVSPPFQIASGGTYSLGANQSQLVAVLYAPTNSGVANQAVTFTGGGGASAIVSGTALPKPPTGLSVSGH